MVGWHHRLNGHEFEQAPGDNEGQGSLVCCSPWGCKESDMTERLNHNKVKEPDPTRSQVSLFPVTALLLSAHKGGLKQTDTEKSGDAGNESGKTALCGNLVLVLVKVFLAWVPELPLNPW